MGDMNERNKSCIVEGIGHVSWTTFNGSDDRWNEPTPIALVKDEEGFRHFITPSMCYRNGTTLNEDIVGLHGRLTFANASPIGFSCPTMFGHRGHPAENK